jgi:hypothetical protein
MNLVPGIHVLLSWRYAQMWMAGTTLAIAVAIARPAMTGG